ncbi:MAG: glucose-6-phosphate dehydrogenase assembly protein OpcA [Actinomycetota bacterium]|nr:glucose-6-phosphate dehydrogenase assembly protein OpcA [Actinomycetota bacterium]
MAAAMMGESRRGASGGALTVDQIEHELGQLRMNEDGTLGLRASVLNLIVVTDEESAPEITESVSRLATQYPSRAILLISDPEGERDLDIQLAAFCNVRGGGGSQVCAEQITIHASGPPARHLESFAGPLLVPDLPVFLWYPGPFSSSSPEFSGITPLADRLIVDSSAAGDAEASLRDLAGLLESGEVPAIGDIQWVALSPWRSLISELFSAHERARELDRIHRVEVLHTPKGECRALILLGWLASALGWELEDASRNECCWRVTYSGPSGEINVETSDDSPDARLRRVRLYGEEMIFQVSRHRELSDASATVMRDGELIGERTVRLGASNLGILLGEELRYRGRDTAYEAALKGAVEVLNHVCHRRL